MERTHSWLNRYRAVLIRWCKKPENFLATLHFALALITYRVYRIGFKSWEGDSCFSVMVKSVASEALDFYHNDERYRRHVGFRQVAASCGQVGAGLVLRSRR